MPKPACPKCQCFYRPKTNGFSFIEGMPLNNAARGKRDPDNWKPYKLWNGDLWECPDCGSQVIVGCGYEPVSEHYKPEFTQAVIDWGATLQINDC